LRNGPPRRRIGSKRRSIRDEREKQERHRLEDQRYAENLKKIIN